MKKLTGNILITLSLSALASCGDSLDEGKAAGVYRGSNSRMVDYYTLVTKNDEIWTVYGNDSDRGFFVQGFLQGQGEAAAGQFRSTDIRDFGFNPPAAFGLTAKYQSNSSFAGSYQIADSTITFTGSATPATLFDFSIPAKIEFIAGNWRLQSPTIGTATLQISATGYMSGSEGLCNYAGTIAPRTDESNVYSHQITFGPQCPQANQTFRGNAVSILSAAGTRQLLIAGVNAARTAGAVFTGTRFQ
jgi:hypothetical protein